jgi:hypothetical protein
MKKVIFTLCYYSVGALLVVWPFALFGSLFMFDAPLHGAWDGAWRLSILGIIAIFPLLYRKAWRRGKEALTNDETIWSILIPLVYPLSAPAWIVFSFEYIGRRV